MIAFNEQIDDPSISDLTTVLQGLATVASDATVTNQPVDPDADPLVDSNRLLKSQLQP